MRKEAKRQIFHALLGTIIVSLFYFNLLPLYLFGIIIITGAIISISWKNGSEVIIGWFLENFERKKEHPGKGALFYFVGCFFALLFFPKNIALASIMILALGDSVSHYIGKFYGKRKHPFNNKRCCEGTVVGTLAGFLGALIFVPAMNAFFASLIAMNLEVIEWKKLRLDDNLIIPLVAGLVMYFLGNLI